MELRLFRADCVGEATNVLYPHEAVVTNADELREAVKRDTVCAQYKGSYRSNENFICSNVIPMDCDNDHTEDPAEWMTTEKVDELLPDIRYAIAPSRHNNIPKDGKPARPKFHIFFPVEEITDAVEYAAVKRGIHKRFPFFDSNAMDAARFLFGSDAGPAVWHEGWASITDEVEPVPADGSEDSGRSSGRTHTGGGSIPAGYRNNTLSRFAGRVLKRYGITDKAYRLFCEEADKCDPPMTEGELKTIWNSAVRFAKKVTTQEGYVPPEEYNDDFGNASLKPKDYSDIGQAKVLAREYGDELCYTDGTDYLRYDGSVWIESKQQAVGAMEEFLDLQLQDAMDAVTVARDALLQSGVPEDAIASGGKALEKAVSGDDPMKRLEPYLKARAYFAFVMKRRDMKYVMSALQAAKPMLQINVGDLDKDEFLLNTTDGTYDLRSGMAGRKAPEALDYITKQTASAPGDGGKQLWLDALELFFCGDRDLIRYVQRIVGMAAVGKVYLEALIIAYGEGRNGKSTFWNTISRVMGSYSGSISADALTVGCKRNVKPEMAELKGKRLIIAAELEEGMRLNTSIIKQLCSTDEISAEKKYKDPFKYVPSHTLVLYTNHLPRVGASDEGTWRRLIVIPFNARIEGKSDIKNYTDFLVENAAPYILQWVIEGAQQVIKEAFKITAPKVVAEAIKGYRENNDWMGIFLEDCCEVGDGLSQKSGELYQEYRAYCLRIGEYARSTTDFYTALDAAGFERQSTRAGKFIRGLSLKSDFME